MQNLTQKELAILIFLGLILSDSIYADDALNKIDSEAKCDFIGYLAYEIALYRDAGISRLSTLSNLEHKYIDNKKISGLVPFYVKQLYTDLTLNPQNVQNIIKHRCLLQFQTLYSQHRY